MAFVYSKASFAGIVTSLGNCDAFLQAAQTGTATSGLSQLQTARGDVADSLGDNAITTTDYDPTHTIATTLIDYRIQQQTGKKISEHALSYATGQDCKIDLNIQEICKDETFLKNNIKNLILEKLKNQSY